MQVRRRNTNFLAVVGAFCFGLAYLLPNHYPPWTGFHHEAVAFFALFILLIAILSGHEEIEVPRATCAISLFSIVPLVQYEMGLVSYSGDALLGMLYLFSFAAAIAIGFNFSRQVDLSQRFFVFFMISLASAAMFSSLLAIAQWQLQEDIFGPLIVNVRLGERSAGNVAQSNHLATLLLMGVVACWFLYQARILSTVSLILAMIVLSMGMLTAESRTVVVSMVALNIFLAFFGKSIKGWKAYLSPLLIWSILFVLASIAWGKVNDFLFLGKSTGFRLDSTGRTDTWRQLWKGIESHPWQGFGWRQTAAAMAAGSEVRPSVSVYEGMTDFGHNIFLDILAWFGLPLGIAVAIFVIFWIGKIAINAKSQRAVFSIAMIIPLGVHSLLEYPYSYAHFFLPAGIFIGYAMSEGGVLTLRHGARMLGFSCAVMAVVSVLTVFDYFRAEEDYRIARYESLNVGVVPDGFSPKKLIILNQLEALIMAARFKPITGLTPDEIGEFSLAFRRFPSVFGQTNLAVALALNGNMDEAKLIFSKIEARFGEESWNRARQRIERLAVERPMLNQLLARNY